MKKIATFLLLLPYLLSSQTVAGIIQDCTSGEVIPYANVYFEGTLRGEHTNADGTFSITVPEAYQGMPLTVSYLGYQTTQVDISDVGPEESIRICLKVRAYELKEVTVEPDEMPWEEKWNLFTRAFLGDSWNADNSEVVNPEDIQLRWSERTQSLQGWAERPVIVRNRALGYIVEYHLEEFSCSSDRIQYYGYYFFREDTSLTRSELRKIKRRRRRAYYGSRLHLVRALYDGQLERNGFALYDLDGAELLPAQVLTKSDGFDYLQESNKIRIRYLGSNRNRLSYVWPHQETLILPNGYYDARSVQWSGEMSDQRVADLLPYEYQPD